MRFRNKRVIVQAVQFTQAMWDGVESWPKGVIEVGKIGTVGFFDTVPVMRSDDGVENVRVGDWIITDHEGKVSRMSDTEFRKTYEPDSPKKPSTPSRDAETLDVRGIQGRQGKVAFTVRQRRSSCRIF